MKMPRYLATGMALAMLNAAIAQAEESAEVDASDPTKIYSYAGPGIKYTDYTNGSTLTELRIIGNLGLGANDMVLFEFGYGQTDIEGGGEDDGLTNGRVRWFHLFNMDNSVEKGYRGMGTQVDLQFAGKVAGTDGANIISVGVLPAFALGERWNFYGPINLVGNWDKDFDKRRGIGAAVSPLFVYTPDWWTGSFLQIWPTYTYFFDGDLDGEGGGNLDLILGGNINPTTIWSATYQTNFDKDFNALKRGVDTGFGNDWNIFANVTWYF